MLFVGPNTPRSDVDDAGASWHDVDSAAERAQLRSKKEKQEKKQKQQRRK